VSFEVVADAYGRFMGRYSEQLAAEFVALTGLAGGARAVDVGCGPGALTAELVGRLGPGAVAGADPSEAFVAAARSRFPAVDIRRAPAEELPFPDDTFDYAFAQLVVHFMSDPVAGLREMARVTKPGGSVAACVWDHAGGRSPVAVFWQAVLALDPAAHDESGLAGARAGHLAELFAAAGLGEIEPAVLTVRRTFAGFDEWWEPYTLGVGPAGDYVRGLDSGRVAALRDECASRLPQQWPIEVSASAWAATGRS
jgi:SAM-dependent methyltransferase